MTMDLSHIVVDALWRPSFVLKYPLLESRLDPKSQRSGPLSWDSSQLNPKNRVDTLDITTSQWRIDGATVCGTHFFALPVCLMPNLIPLRIDVFLPDQGDYPAALRDILDSSVGVALRHPRPIANLGISRHLCRALDSYCDRNPGFLNYYQKLPFGSKLFFENVAADVADMRLSITPAHHLERQSVSVESLQQLWAEDITQDRWPEAVDISCLQLIRQLHDTISVVRVVENGSLQIQPLIFKSNIENLELLYHELRFLLRNPPHPNIMPRPLHIVTKKCLFGGKHGVFGFTLPYYPEGSIRDILPVRVQNGSLSFTQKMKWCREITSALIHIRERAGTFFSDLRPDNVLLSSANSTPVSCQNEAQDDNESVVLCDFEQRGNWHEWCAPEVLYRQYIENIRSSRLIHPAGRWSSLMSSLIEACSSGPQLLAPHRPISNVSLESFVQMKNCAWFSLSPESQEKAQVYSLGLFIYCVFEGLSNVRRSIANAYPCEPEVEFPEFKRTPPVIQDIIKQCTIDAPERQGLLQNDPSKEQDCSLPPRSKRVIRIGGKLYPEGHPIIDGNSDCMVKEVLDTALRWWIAELERAAKFLESEEWQSGNFGKDRPTLREVFEALKRIDERATV